MSEQTGIFLTDSEVLELADTLHDYAVEKDYDWAKGDNSVLDKIFARAVEILITKGNEDELN